MDNDGILIACDLTPFLGQPVTIIVDRTLGSRHPRHSDIVYPVNYGFLPNTISGFRGMGEVSRPRHWDGATEAYHGYSAGRRKRRPAPC